MNTNHLNKFGYQQQLKGSLGLWQITAFGLNYMIPLSPAIIYGFVLIRSGGTVALPFLLAGIAMLLTGITYATMVKHFPLAGSLYNFISRAWHPRIGFIGGWIISLDYLLITTVTSMSAATYIHQLVPNLSYYLMLTLFVITTGLINILGINIIASLGIIFLLFAEIIVFISFMVWSYAIQVHHIGAGTLLSMAPFHYSNIHALINATSLAVASYLGFDAITTLAEESDNPIKNIPRAILLCITLGGITMVITGYLGVLAIPHWQQFTENNDWLATALQNVCEVTGGHIFAVFYTVGFILSMAVFNIVATAATARLFFGMGRDNLLRQNIFAVINKKWHTPHWNVLLIIAINLVIGSFFQIDEIADLVNYGALLGFALLNISLIQFYLAQQNTLNFKKTFTEYLQYLISPLIGFIVVISVFCGLNRETHIVGTIWLFIGIIYSLFLNKEIKTLSNTVTS